MNQQSNRTFRRRSVIAGGAAGVATGVATSAFLARQAFAGPYGAVCDCLTAPSSAPVNPGGATRLNYQTSANIPTPREQTVIFEAHESNIFDSFNPYIPNGEAYFYGVNQLAREGLFYANFLTGEIIPWLAEEWTYNDDYTELTLALNPAAAWSDGTPYTAADFVFTFEMLRNNEGLTGAGTVIENVESVAAPDDQTVVITLVGPRPRFHYNFIVGIVFDGLKIVPQHIWEGEDPNTFKNNPPIYTGPYVIDQIIPEQFMYVWKKNPDYWNSANLDPKPEFAVFRQFLPTDAAIQEFQRGNIDVANADSIGYQAQQTLLGSYDQVATFEFADPCPRAFFPNFESPTGLFATPEGRWAISNLIDRDLIANAIWQPASRPTLYPWADYASNEQWNDPALQAEYPLVYDPVRAEKLLAAAGAVKEGGAWSMNGAPLQLQVIIPGGTTVQEYQIAQTLADNARDIGLDIVLNALTFPAWTDAANAGQFDLNCAWVCGLAFDPSELYDNFLTEDVVPLGEASTRGNLGRVSIPELDEVVGALQDLSPDDAAAAPLFADALELFYQNLPVIPTIQTTFPVTFGTAYWTGWPTTENPNNIPMYWWAQFLFVIGGLEPVTPA